jgi:hypothetical protein
MVMEVPRQLRSWLLAHAVVHIAAALPLLVVPGLALSRLGWTAVHPVAARLAGAALLAVGTASLLARDAGPAVVRARARLNLAWSFAAATALFVYIGAGAPPAAWAFLSIFIVFSGVWLHHAIRFRQLDHAAALDEPGDAEGEPEPPEGTNA